MSFLSIELLICKVRGRVKVKPYLQAEKAVPVKATYTAIIFL